MSAMALEGSPLKRARKGLASPSATAVPKPSPIPRVPREMSHQRDSASDFEPLRFLGKGAFGAVVLVRRKRGAHAGATFAMKLFLKSCTAYDGAVDYWSLGILLYEMCAGSTPFEAERPRDLFRNILHEAPRLGALPEAARPTVGALLAKEPARRPKLDRLRHEGESLCADVRADLFAGFAYRQESAARAPAIPERREPSLGAASTGSSNAFSSGSVLSASDGGEDEKRPKKRGFLSSARKTLAKSLGKIRPPKSPTKGA
ncbi:serine/threonine kinase [Aureococcus anophagefferens]|nr:serine/threonine kinase [Aureococcus anophagefferens]